MKECEQRKQELEEAKDNLRRLLEKQEELKKDATEAAAKKAYADSLKDAKARAEAQEAVKKAEAARKVEEKLEVERLRETGKLDAAAEKKKENINQELDHIEGQREAFEEKIAIEKRAYSEAELEYKKEAEKLLRKEQEFQKAADELRKFRRPPHVDNNGGVYNVPDADPRKSNAPMRSFTAVMALLIGSNLMN